MKVSIAFLSEPDSPCAPGSAIIGWMTSSLTAVLKEIRPAGVAERAGLGPARNLAKLSGRFSSTGWVNCGMRAWAEPRGAGVFWNTVYLN